MISFLYCAHVRILSLLLFDYEAPKTSQYARALISVFMLIILWVLMYISKYSISKDVSLELSPA